MEIQPHPESQKKNIITIEDPLEAMLIGRSLVPSEKLISYLVYHALDYKAHRDISANLAEENTSFDIELTNRQLGRVEEGLTNIANERVDKNNAFVISAAIIMSVALAAYKKAKS
jgi:hypothetical protein